MRNRRTYGTAILAGLLLVAGSACSKEEKPRPESLEVRHGEGYAALYLDGWSARSLNPQDLRFATMGEESPGRVVLREIEEGDVAQLLAETPGVLEQLLARMVSADPTLRCTPKGCRGAGGEIDPYLLVHPERIEGLGEMYAAWGITSGAMVAQLRVGESHLGRLSYGDSEVLLDDAAVLVDPELAEYGGAGDVAGESSNGFASGVWTVGYGLGELFVLDARWIREPAGIYQVSEPAPGEPQGEVRVGENTEAALNAPLFVKGLGELTKTAAGLNPGQLSFMTAPSTGCGGVALCVPGVIETTVRTIASQRLDVCAQQRWRASLVLHTSELEARLPAPVHQAGAWGGRSPKEFDGARDVPVLFSGVPPLVRGDLRLRLQGAYLISEDRVISVEVRAGQLGVDRGDSVEGVLGADDLPALFNGILRACPAGELVPPAPAGGAAGAVPGTTPDANATEDIVVPGVAP